MKRIMSIAVFGLLASATAAYAAAPEAVTAEPFAVHFLSKQRLAGRKCIGPPPDDLADFDLTLVYPPQLSDIANTPLSHAPLEPLGGEYTLI